MAVGKMSSGIIRACSEWPHLAGAILLMRPIESDGLDYAAVDKFWNMYYNPENINKLSVNQVAFIVVHEVMHLLMRHFKRGDKFPDINKIAKGIAADLAINSYLSSCIHETSLDFPDNILFPDNFKLEHGLSFEQYLMLIKDKVIEVHVDFGSGATGEKAPWEDWSEHGQSPKAVDINSSVPEMFKGLNDDEYISERDLSSAGITPGDMNRSAENFKSVFPEKLLSRIVMRKISETRRHGTYRTYRFPPRRENRHFMIPSKIMKDVNIAVVVDTSGSMSNEELGVGLDIVRKALKISSVGRVRVVSGDVRKVTDQVVSSVREIQFGGGGGTDMDRLIRETIKDEKPDLIICVTDGDSYWSNERPPSVPVIFALTKGTGVNIPWGEKVDVNPYTSR